MTADETDGCPRNECQIRQQCTRPTVCLSGLATVVLVRGHDPHVHGVAGNANIMLDDAMSPRTSTEVGPL